MPVDCRQQGGTVFFMPTASRDSNLDTSVPSLVATRRGCTGGSCTGRGEGVLGSPRGRTVVSGSEPAAPSVRLVWDIPEPRTLPRGGRERGWGRRLDGRVSGDWKRTGEEPVEELREDAISDYGYLHLLALESMSKMSRVGGDVVFFGVEAGWDGEAREADCIVRMLVML